MLKKSIVLASVIALGACAYTMDGAIQEVKVITPGAHNAACDVYIEKLRYRVNPPQTITIYKSDEDLSVDCKAPGNRQKTVYIQPNIEQTAAWNAANLGIGAAWDLASKAAYRYPDIIEVNFTDTPVKSQPLPAQNNPDIRQPEEYRLEEFSPGVPQMNRDKTSPAIEILRRETQGYGNVGASLDHNGTEAFSESADITGGKAEIMDVVNGLSAQINPSSSDAVQPIVSETEGGPVPLIPGE